MKFNLEGCGKFMSHLLLESNDLAGQVSKTSLWVEDGVLEATLQINGVEVPAEHLESFMKGLWEHAENQLRKKYKTEDFDRRVEEKAKQLLKDHADNALEELYDLTNKLENIGDVLTPHWEREDTL